MHIVTTTISSTAPLPHVYAPKAMKPLSIFYWVVIGSTLKDLFSCPLLLTSLQLLTSLTPKLSPIFFYMDLKTSLSMLIRIFSMLLLPSSAPPSDSRSLKLFRRCKSVARGCLMLFKKVATKRNFVTTVLNSTLFGWRVARSFYDKYSHIPFYPPFICFV